MSNNSFLNFTKEDFALSTDLYELTMAAAYFDNNIDQRSVFELFVRELPGNRGYLVFAGLEQVIEYLQTLRFSGAQIDYLKSLPYFKNVNPDFFEYLREFKFQGDVDAMREGSIFFANEPVLRIEGGAIEAQIVETFLLSVVNFQSLIATKTARIVSVAEGRPVIEFGFRRAHTPLAGLMGARASIIGGAETTSNVLAAERLGLVPSGTMAHSWVMSFKEEADAFSAFLKVFPGFTIFLIDTYDTIKAVKTVIKMGLKGFDGVRIDSGNMENTSHEVRRILDKGGLEKVKIFSTGDLNENIIESLVKAKSPIDGFGVGTELITSRDDPALGGIYKLVAIKKDGVYSYRLKKSERKETIPGLKQIYRFKDKKYYSHDLISEINEKPLKGGEPLIYPVMRNGKLIQSLPDIKEAVNRCRDSLKLFSQNVRDIHNPAHYQVKISPHLEYLAETIAVS